MKKTFKLLIFVLAMIMLVSSASALTLLAEFESTGNDEVTLNFGESENYLVGALYSHYSPLLQIEGALFEVTNEGTYYKKDLFSVEHTEAPFYEEAFTITQNDYEAEGVYIISVKATETKDNGDQITRSKTLYLAVNGDDDDDDDEDNISPVANFTYFPENPVVGEGVNFTSTSYDEDGIIVKEEWVLKSSLIGQTIHQGVNETTFIHNFNKEGFYDITLTVTDDDGATDSITKTIFIDENNNLFLVANFTYFPENPVIGGEVEFISTSYGVNTDIVNEEWFIDEELVHQGVNETTFNYVFGEEGSYEVKLIVEDNEGATAEKTELITVSEAGEEGLVAVISGHGSPFVGDLVTYDASGSYDTSGAEIVSYEWVVHRGAQLIHEEVTTQPFFDFVFQVKGAHTVTVIVTNEHGEEAEASMNVYASRPYNTEEQDFGKAVSVAYHTVTGEDFGVAKMDEEFMVGVSMTNNKNYDIVVRGTFTLPEYGISARSGSVSLTPGETKNIRFPVLISHYDYIPTGNHVALIGVSGSGISRSLYFPLTLTK